MLEITVRPATDEERLVRDEATDDWPKGVFTFDDTDWNAHFFIGIGPGDWVVEIKDPEKILKWQQVGHFIVHMHEDSGALRQIG